MDAPVLRSIRDTIRWRKPLISIEAKYRQWKTKQSNWVAGRVACMGLDVFNMMDTNLALFNIQKGRVDYLVTINDNPDLRARTSKVEPYMERRDVIGLIAQQEVWSWPVDRPPLALYMDSFSELTDQLFIHRRGHWQFCANYSDVRHSSAFMNQFEACGLLPIDELSKHYRHFFEVIRRQYGNIPIVFMHFPVKLDQRKKFQMQYRSILNAVEQMAIKYPPFYSFTVDEGIVDWPEEQLANQENFPYHYNKWTYQSLAEQIRTTGIFQDRKNLLDCY